MTRDDAHLPAMGQWHQTLEHIEPDARPTRPAMTYPEQRRQQAVARRSRRPLAPGGRYYFWCEHCDYCNTADEGEAARCPNHRRAYEADRKARWRQQEAPASGTPTSAGGAQPIQQGDRPLTGGELQNLRRLAARVRDVSREYETALYKGTGPHVKRDFDAALSALLQAIADLPR